MPNRMNGVVIGWDERRFHNAMKLIKDTDAATYKNLRSTIRKIGNDLKRKQAAAVRAQKIRKGGSTGSGRNARAVFFGGGAARSAAEAKRAVKSRSLRETVARSLAVEVRERSSKRVREAGVRIRLRASLMPPDQRRLPKHMNYGQWRHPVFGMSEDPWVQQIARPRGWFDETFGKNRYKATQDIRNALNAAYSGLGLE